MIPREEYLQILKDFKDKELIKVVTGIRRCGKSTLFDLFQEYLLENEVEKSQIIRINLEDPIYHNLTDYMSLYNFVLEKLNLNKKNYVFLDEVQVIPEFQKACDGLFIKKNVDLYITGSNADLLSGELATLLSGRYIEIKMLPLSFKEYVYASSNENVDRLFQKYISNGAFPYTLSLNNEDNIELYIKSIYDTILLKDIMARHKYTDMLLFQSVINFLLDNIGNLTSINKIANTLTSNGRNISIHTLEDYVNSLQESFIFYRAGRYDVKGKEYLKTKDKYYVSDLGLRYFLLGRREGDQGHILENVVFLELKRRGYDVYVGKLEEYEVDFVAMNSKTVEYYQVALTLRDENVLARELRPLETIKDHYPKFLLTMDIDPEVNYNGIRKINVLDWLLDK